jgi:hypothetical protein
LAVAAKSTPRARDENQFFRYRAGVNFHYERRVIHGKDMLVKVYPPGKARGAHTLSCCTMSKPSTGKSLSEAQTLSKKRFGKKGRFKKNLNFR